MKTSAICAVVVSCLGLFAPPLYAQRVGYFNLQRVLAETQEGQSAKRRLEVLSKRRQAELEELQDGLLELERLIKSEVLTPEKQAEAVERAQKTYLELQASYAKSQRELTERETQETGQILGKVQKILFDLGQREEYGEIVEVNEGGIFYFPPALDLTNELIRLYDERHPGRGGPTKASAKAQGTKRRQPPRDVDDER